MNGAARASGIRLSGTGQPGGDRLTRRALPATADLDQLSVTAPDPRLTGQLPLGDESAPEPVATPGAHERDESDTGNQSGQAWELVRSAQNGDAAAFGQLYDRYVDVVFRYVLFRIGDRSLAEDVTSETFLRAFRRINSVSYQGRDVGAWFVTIARNIVLDHVKSSRFRLEVSTADPDDGQAVDVGPETQVLANIAHAELLHCVEQLGDDQRECIVLRFLQGLSVAETAEIMHRNAGAIKALQHRAVRRLAQLLRTETS
jgi:RNA polymerase sigma-70 factor (ECF subfamily)